MKKRILTLALCALMLLSSVPVLPVSFGTAITASAADTDVTALRAVYNEIPKKEQWNQFIDTTQLAKFYDDATAILAAPNTYSQNNIDMTATNLKNAWEAVRYHTTEIRLDKTSISGAVGETVTLNAILLPTKAGDPVEWITNAPDVASVTGSGENKATGSVKILKYSAQAVTITAVSNNHNVSCTLRVNNPMGGIRLSSTTLNVFKGQNVTLKAEPYGADQNAAMSDAVTSTLWTSSNASVATVSQEGVVHAVSQGYATITVTMIAGGKTLDASCSVTVNKPTEVTKLKPLTITEGGDLRLSVGASETVRVGVEPANASIKELQWTSSDPEVASISGVTLSGSESSAKVKAVKEGTAVVTYSATDGSGIFGSFNVVVTPMVKSVTVSPAKLVVTVGDTSAKLTAAVTPADAGNQVLRWESDNPNICEVDYSGKLNPKIIGTCHITATTTDGSALSGSCFVRVADPAASVSIDKTSLSLKVGEAPIALKATVRTSGSMTYNEVDWSSANTAVATVDAEGLVTAVRPGTTTIKATALDGTDKAAVCTVTVTAELQEISLPAKEEVTVGGNLTLTPTLTPAFASDKSVTWTSLDNTVASVNASGVVTGKKEGNTVITCSSKANPAVKADCVISVIIPVKSVTLSKYNLSLEAGQTDRLTAEINPKDATDQTVTWASSNENVAVVSDNGEVRAVHGGTCTITCTSNSGSKTASCAVTVIEHVTGVSFQQAQETLYVTETRTLKPLVRPETATDHSMDWQSSNSNVATVNAVGTVTAVAPGSAIVSIVTKDGGFTDRCTINVVPKVNVTGIDIENKAITLAQGMTYGINAEVFPHNASNKQIKWTSNAPSVATVNADGVVTAVKAGTAIITAATVDGNYSMRCTVTVTQTVSGVTVTPTAAQIAVGSSKTLTASIQPSNATSKGVTWYTSNEAVATVNGRGIVVGVAPGTATITALTDEGGFSDACTVTVYVAQNGIKINSEKVTVAKGSKTVLTATITPANASDQKIVWSSDNTSICTVNQAGQVNGIKKGSAVITVKTADGKLQDTCLVEVVQLATSLKLDYNTLQLDVGKTKTLTATMKPASASNKKVRWTSSDKTVATVDGKGKVTGVKAGTAIIKVVSGDKAVSTTCKVTVIQRVTSITFKEASPTVKVGKKKTLAVKTLPESASETAFTWTSSNKKIAKVSKTGKVKGLAPGTVTITVSNADGSAKAKCRLSVLQGVTGMKFDKASMTVSRGKKAAVKANIEPANAADKTLTWTSSNNDVATVDSKGVVTAKAVGYAVITGKTNDGGFVDTCRVNVVYGVKRVKLNKTSATLEVDEKLTLTPTISPKNATNKDVKWTSSDKNVAKVTSKGVVKALAKGTAVITVSTVDGGYTATCTVSVIKKATGVKISRSKATVEKGDTYQLSASVQPTDATIRTVKWSSSNKKIATVNDKGLVTALAAGKVKITAKTTDGGFKKSCVVTVRVSPKSIALNHNGYELSTGKTLKLKAALSPADATGGVTWTSSNNRVAVVSSKGVVSALKGGTATVTAKTENGLTASCRITVRQLAEKIKLSKTALTLSPNERATLTATVTPASAVYATVEWTSDNTKVAQVTQKGVVTGLLPGAATITAKNLAGDVSAVCKVTVRKAVTSVSLSDKELTLTAPDTAQLTAIIAPADASIQTVKWYSSDPEVATVSDKGLVTPTGSGETVITVKTTDGGLKATCTVSVTVPVTGINVPAEKTFYVGQKASLGITTVPARATNRAITYTIADPSIASINSNGEIEPYKNGMTSVTAKTVEGGFSKTMRIQVETKVTGITLDKNELKLGVGDTKRLIASVAPAAATNKKVLWTSGNEAVATVSETGEITAKALGVAVITAKTADGGKVATCAVTVLVPVKSITLSDSQLRLTKGQTATLTATLDPENATYKTVVWTSDNSVIASVSSNGVVTANDRGNAVITASSEDGTVQATCVVSVSELI